MALDQLPKSKTEMIPSCRVPVLHKDSEYTLFGALFSATMHKDYSHRNVKFEISIGTNVFELDLATSKSEGDRYYSLKWEGKPENLIQVRQVYS